MNYSIEEESVSIFGIGKTVLLVEGLFFSISTRKRVGVGTNTDTDSLHLILSTCKAKGY